MDKKSLNRLIFWSTIGVFVVVGAVVWWAMATPVPEGYEAAGHAVEAHEDGDIYVGEEAEVPAYAEPIHDLEAAVEQAGENVAADLAEGENPLADEEAAPQPDAEEGAEGAAVLPGTTLEAPEAAPETEEAAEAVVYECDFDHWIGENVAGLELDTFDRPYRVLEPGAMYTTDHVPERINVHIDEQGEIIDVTCG